MSEPRFTNEQISLRLKVLQELFIDRPDLREVRAALEDRLEIVGRAGDAVLSLLIAPSRCGKSTIISEFAREMQAKHPGAVAVATLPSNCTAKGMTERILSALNDPIQRSGTERSNTNRIVGQIKQQGVRLLILDEFQNLFDTTQQAVLREALKWLRDTLDRASIPVICVGLPESVHVINSDKTIQGRTGSLMLLKPFRWDNAEGTQAFRSFLYKLEEAIPFKDPSNLASPALAKAMHDATQGLVGLVTRLVREATMRSMRRLEGPDALTAADLAYAQERLPEFNGINPFETDSFAFDEPGDERALSNKGPARRTKRTLDDAA